MTGGGGYLGSEVCARAAERDWDVFATRYSTPPPVGRPVALDLRDAIAVESAFLRLGPEGVIHTAYRQSDDALEDDVVRATVNVAGAAARFGVRLVHLSTDLVFDGEIAGRYTEADEPRPVSAYGAAKLAAERAVAGLAPDAVVVRTSLLYGKPEPGPQERLAARTDIVFYTDEIRCPTRVGELADALLELAERRDVSGPLHVAGPDAVSRYELALLLAPDPRAVRGGPSPTAAGRARNVALDCSRAADLLQTRLRGVKEVLRSL